MKNVVVLLSGGLDSTTMLWLALAQGHKPITLSVDYGQRAAETERRMAAAAAGSRGLQHKHLAVPLVATVTRSALTTGGDLSLPADTVVPGRNALLLSLGAGLAQSVGAESVQIGCNLTDSMHYPDCHQEFIDCMDRALSRAYRISVEAPLLQYNKAEVVRLAIKLGVPLEATSSCYRGTACGECAACRIRMDAIAEVI